jgi:hypothetical protein
MRSLIGCLLAVAALSAAQGKQTFVGIITDDMCDRADHSHMRMGPTDAECAAACASEHDAAYVLFDGKTVYKLSDQRASQEFAGKKVTVSGTLDTKTKTIRVDSIRAAR